MKTATYRVYLIALSGVHVELGKDAPAEVMLARIVGERDREAKKDPMSFRQLETFVKSKLDE